MTNAAISETPSTVEGSLRDAFEALCNILTPENQQRCREMGNFYPPTVEKCVDDVGNHKIVIHGLPASELCKFNQRDIEDLAITDICHQIMHLYADGDRAGKTAIAEKRKHGQPLESNGLRLYVIYSISPSTVNGETVLQILFTPNDSELSFPVRIRKISREGFSASQIGEMRKQGLIEHTTRSEIFVREPMLPTEAQEHFAVFVHTCYEEINQYLQKIFDDAIKNHTVPNYLAPATKS